MGDVYLIKSPSDKYYVGQAVKKLKSGKNWGYLSRWKSHISEANRNLNYCRLLDNAIRKYGHENFEVSLLCECTSLEELNEKEVFYIEKYNSLTPNGYNLITGGNKNQIHSKETCEKKVLVFWVKIKGEF